MNQIFTLIRKLKKIPAYEIAKTLEVHFSAVNIFDLYGHGLGTEKVNKYASLLGFSVLNDRISFDPNVVHTYYLPVLPKVRKINMSPFFDFIKLCKINITQIVLFTEEKYTDEILVHDITKNVFIFLPRRGKHIAKTIDIINELQKKFDKECRISICEKPHLFEDEAFCCLA